MAKPSRPPKPWTPLRWAGHVALWLVLLGSALYGFHRFEQFLIHDPRFTLPEATGPSPFALYVSGIHHVSRGTIEQVFAADRGRSVYSLPLATRRNQLRQMEWVKDAAVVRVWPNQVYVRLQERVPVARLPRAPHGPQWVIDGEGVLLRESVPVALPLVSGIPAHEPIEQRARRVRFAQRAIQDLAGALERVRWLDVSDLENIKAAWARQDGVLLWLGDRNFRTRLEGFENTFAEIQRRLPGEKEFDLRLDGRISTVGKAE
jgi:hypothetical protein